MKAVDLSWISMALFTTAAAVRIIISTAIPSAAALVVFVAFGESTWFVSRMAKEEGREKIVEKIAAVSLILLAVIFLAVCAADKAFA